jgi:hypothetical protein
MQIKIIVSLILLASAGATVRADPAPSVAMVAATAESVELDNRRPMQPPSRIARRCGTAPRI